MNSNEKGCVTLTLGILVISFLLMKPCTQMGFSGCHIERSTTAGTTEDPPTEEETMYLRVIEGTSELRVPAREVVRVLLEDKLRARYHVAEKTRLAPGQRFTATDTSSGVVLRIHTGVGAYEEQAFTDDPSSYILSPYCDSPKQWSNAAGRCICNPGNATASGCGR